MENNNWIMTSECTLTWRHKDLSFISHRTVETTSAYYCKNVMFSITWVGKHTFLITENMSKATLSPLNCGYFLLKKIFSRMRHGLHNQAIQNTQSLFLLAWS